MHPLLAPHLRAVPLTLLSNPVVAFQMRGDITIGGAVSSSFIIHFKQPTPHFQIANDQLAENTNHLRGKQWHKAVLQEDNIKLFLDLDLQLSNIWT